MNREILGFQVHDSPTKPRSQPPRQLDLQRLYPAVIFVPLFYVIVRHFPPSVFFLLVTGAALFALWEFYDVYFKGQPRQLSAAIGLGTLTIVLGIIQWSDMIAIPLILMVIIVTILFSYMNFPDYFKRLTIPTHTGILFGVLYIGISLGHLLLIRKLGHGDLLIFFVVLVTWSADVGAYYTGVTIGRRPIAPRLSPKKTVEGFAGGLLVAVLTACASRFWFLPSLSLLDCFAIGTLLASIGLLGDLAESAFKRSSGVKDSGTLIPGHGGMLDRLDSLLLTAPAFYYYVLLFKGPTALL